MLERPGPWRNAFVETSGKAKGGNKLPPKLQPADILDLSKSRPHELRPGVTPKLPEAGWADAGERASHLGFDRAGPRERILIH